MWSSSIVASLHYLALAIGLPAIFLRGRALKGTLDDAGLRRLFTADSMWGVAAALWLATAAAGAVVDRRRRPQWLRAGAAVFTAHAISVVVKRLARRIRPVHEEVAVHVSTPSRWSFGWPGSGSSA